MPKRDSGDLARLLARKAASDEAILTKLLDDPEVPDDVLGFHAQQAVEKLLKAVLAARGASVERTHSVAYLLALLADLDVAEPPRAEELHSLTPWATEFRYEEVFGAELDRVRARELVAAIRVWADEAIG